MVSGSWGCEDAEESWLVVGLFKASRWRLSLVEDGLVWKPGRVVEAG